MDGLPKLLILVLAVLQVSNSKNTPQLNQGGSRKCPFGTWRNGIKAIETRVTMVTDNYVPWSAKNVVLCANLQASTGCLEGGTVHDTLVEHPDYIIPRNQLISRKCFHRHTTRKYKKENCKCVDAKSSSAYTQLLDKQWYFIGRKRDITTTEELHRAVESGPVWTCFGKDSATGGCTEGCTHTALILGSFDSQWYVREYGDVGTNTTTTTLVDEGSICEAAMIKTASYSEVYYDYNRANAYFIRRDMDFTSLQFVNRDKLNVDDLSNLGMAKRRCSLLGGNCKGVVKLQDSSIELVSDFTTSPSHSSTTVPVDFFQKVQMVVYLRSDQGRYITIERDNRKAELTTTPDRELASPFFISSSRFVSYDYPSYVISPSKRLLVKDSPEDMNPGNFWYVRDANLQNIHSGLSMDVDSTTNTIIGTPFDKKSLSQRFDVYLSGIWNLYSSKLGFPLRSFRKEGMDIYKFGDEDASTPQMLQWQGRQLVLQNGQPFLPDWRLSEEGFSIADGDNDVKVTDGVLTAKFLYGDEKFLSVTAEGKLVMTKESEETKWSFEYDDI